MKGVVPRAARAVAVVVLVGAAVGLGTAYWRPKGGLLGHAGYARGDALRYLPEDCPAYRVAVDVPGLWSAVGSRELLDAARRAKPTADLLAAFEESGIDPARDLQDLGFCGLSFAKNDEERGRLVVAMGGALGGEHALERYKAVVERLSHVDASQLSLERAGKTPYLVSRMRRKHVWIAMPAPDVLVFSTEDVAAVADLAPHGVDDEAWQRGPGVVAGFDVDQTNVHGSAHLRGRVTSGAGAVAVEATLRQQALAGLDMAKLDTIRQATADALDHAGLVELSGPVRASALALTEGVLRARIEAPGTAWGRVLQELDERPSLVGAVLAELMRRPGE